MGRCRGSIRPGLRLAGVAVVPLLVAGLPARASAQQTVGVFLNDPRSEPGYTLVAPMRSTRTYLVDNAGRLVHDWTSTSDPGAAVYLCEDGNLLRTETTGNMTFRSGGAGGRIRILDWDSVPVWSFTYSTTGHLQHHDAKRLPNGNVVTIAWELKTRAESIAAGRNPALLTDNALWPDHVIEIEPDGLGGGRIVWEWHLWDHLVQDFDATKANYGTVASSPELVDVNFTGGGAMAGAADWTHVNAIAYHEAFDQLVISSHNTSEIWVIDHGTTTAEAAGHTGGRYGKGGDLLYRWGNPQAYRAGTAADRKLFGQHDAQWIPVGRPGAGELLIFNNGAGRPGGNLSSADEITVPVDGN